MGGDRDLYLKQRRQAELRKQAKSRKKEKKERRERVAERELKDKDRKCTPREGS